MNRADEAVLRHAAHAALPQTLVHTHFSGFAGRGAVTRYEGKVRDCYIDGARGERIIVVTDRLSAFDAVVTTIPFKGQVLNQLAAYWFAHTAQLAPNHVVSVPDPNVMIAREVRPLPVEFVMRSYLTGVTSTSIWRAYEQGAREFCGHALPSGLKKNQRLPAPILTPSTKAAKGGHDVSVSRDEILAQGLLTEGEFAHAATLVETLFAEGQRVAAARGLILADTKYELGVTATGELIVIDEIHTPDSSRYWYADDYEARLRQGMEPRGLDKEYVRRYLLERCGWSGEGPPPMLPDEVRVEAALRYIASYELLTGQAFVPSTEPPVARLAARLGAQP